MKYVAFSFSILLFILVTAFSGNQEEKSTSVKAGLYGVCGQDSANPNIELVLMENMTFRYYNVSYLAGTADCTGKWKEEKGAVILYDHNNPFPIHTKWKVEDGNCLKSLKAQGTGIVFFRICHDSTCK